MMKDFDTEAPSLPSLQLDGALAKFLEEAATLESAFKSLPEVDGDSVDSAYYQQLSAILKVRILPFYAAYDAYVHAALKMEDRPITCSKSCSACCRHFVSSVEPFELAALHLHIRDGENYPDILFASHKNSTVYEKIMEAEVPDEEAADRALYRYFLKSRACPFLQKDGACGVYEYRPMSCRMFFAESPARFCAGKAIASPWNRNFQIELPEVAEEALGRCSQYLEALDLPEELFPGVLATNALFGQYDNEDR
jgi:Fe-S-cluster containining protein